VVLPVEMWAEQEGHFVNLEGRVQTAQKALTAPEGVRSNLDVLVDLAARMGFTVDPLLMPFRARLWSLSLEIRSQLMVRKEILNG